MNILEYTEKKLQDLRTMIIPEVERLIALHGDTGDFTDDETHYLEDPENLKLKHETNLYWVKSARKDGTIVGQREIDDDPPKEFHYLAFDVFNLFTLWDSLESVDSQNKHWEERHSAFFVEIRESMHLSRMSLKKEYYRLCLSLGGYKLSEQESLFISDMDGSILHQEPDLFEVKEIHSDGSITALRPDDGKVERCTSPCLFLEDLLDLVSLLQKHDQSQVAK